MATSDGDPKHNPGDVRGGCETEKNQEKPGVGQRKQKKSSRKKSHYKKTAG
jgi:hypothetical protein